MLDWQKLVRRRLSRLALDACEKEEVHAELAAHLEEMYELARCRGMGEEKASQFVLAQVTDWKDLQHKIQNARQKENTMTPRVTQFWLPGLLTFTLSMGLLALVQRFEPQAFILHLGKVTPVLMFNPGWLLTLPLAGAIGAYLSKRAGGSLRMVLASSIFSALPFAVVYLNATAISSVMSRNLALRIVKTALLTITVGWVLLPGAALFAAGLLVHLLFSRRSASHGLTTS